MEINLLVVASPSGAMFLLILVFIYYSRSTWMYLQYTGSRLIQEVLGYYNCYSSYTTVVVYVHSSSYSSIVVYSSSSSSSSSYSTIVVVVVVLLLYSIIYLELQYLANGKPLSLIFPSNQKTTSKLSFVKPLWVSILRT